MNDINSSINYVAEISANHLGSLSRAHELIDVATGAGATSVKFQTYKPETMTLDLDHLSVGSDHKLWGGRNLFSLYKEAMTPWEWHQELFDHCKANGVTPFSSPFDPSAVSFLESIDAPMYKIASLETSDHQLIRMVGETGKPTIISTGATELREIDELVEVFLSTGNQNLTLLVCTSAYPAIPKDANLRRISELQSRFNLPIGISDHTLSLSVPLVAIALGARVIEKHLTISREDGGADAAFSLEPSEFKSLVLNGNDALASLGQGDWNLRESERESRRLRRSLFIVCDVRAGEEISLQNLKPLRPGDGVSPKHLKNLIGMKFLTDFKMGTPMKLEFATK
jgi:pseudaminic acid synthase